METTTEFYIALIEKERTIGNAINSIFLFI